jgi:hypothetical protein
LRCGWWARRQHAGTCRQFLQGGGGAGAGAERFLSRLRARFLVCPVCRSGIEKVSGCNHMTCWCGAHFCAVCGQVLPPPPAYPISFLRQCACVPRERRDAGLLGGG